MAVDDFDDLLLALSLVEEERAMYVMRRKASNEEDRVRVRDTGGSRSSGGRGWDDSNHLQDKHPAEGHIVRIR
jgi:hypothetical protein